MTPILCDLHWLPVRQRIVFKLLLTCYKALNDVGLLYIKDLLPLAKDKWKGLRNSKDPLLLEDFRTHRVTCGDWSFCAAGPREWNNLPLSIRHLPLSILFFLLSRHVCSRLLISASDTYVFSLSFFSIYGL